MAVLLPTLDTTNETIINVWKVGSVLYGRIGWGFFLMFRFKALLSSFVEFDYEADYGTPDYTITSFPSTGTGVFGFYDVLIAIDANISSTNDGVLIDLGGNGGAGLAVGRQ